MKTFHLSKHVYMKFSIILPTHLKINAVEERWSFAGNNYLYKMDRKIFVLFVIQLFITLTLAKIFFKEEFTDGGKFLFRSRPEYISFRFCFRSYTKLSENIDLINTCMQSTYMIVMFYFSLLFQSFSSMLYCFFLTGFTTSNAVVALSFMTKLNL